jgi:hypothetical protein
MTQKITVRQLVEFTVEVDDREGNEWDLEEFDRKVAEGELDIYDDAKGGHKVLVTEIVSRDHEIDYVLDTDLKREMHLLRADGEIIFEHRNHDEVVLEWGRRTGTKITFTPLGERGGYGSATWMSYGDPDEAWDLISGRTKHEDLKQD